MFLFKEDNINQQKGELMKKLFTVGLVLLLVATLTNFSAEASSNVTPEVASTALSGLAGDYYIPQGSHAQGFATLGEAIAALNTNGATGPVRFLIDADLNELGSQLIITRNDLTAATPVIIKPAPTKTPSITITSFPTTGNHAKQGFTIENASYITIDGSNTEGGKTKDLTIIGDDAVNGLYVVGVIDNSDYINIINVKNYL